MRELILKLQLNQFFNPAMRIRQERRKALLDLLRGGSADRGLPAAQARYLLQLSQLHPEGAVIQLASHQDGLSDSVAAERLGQLGANEVEHDRPPAWHQLLWLCYRTPFNLLLSVLAIVSALTDDMAGGSIIALMVALSSLLRFGQEQRSNRAAAGLKALVDNTATVLRRHGAGDAGDEAARFLRQLAPSRLELPFRRLAPGDIVLLSAGDMVPADLRLLSAKDLFVNQASLTGESMPQEKHARACDGAEGSPLQCGNLCFMGSAVVSGSARALVVATGRQTYFGALAERVAKGPSGHTAFQQGVSRISWLLIRFMLAMVPLVLLLNGFAKGDWSEAALFAVAVAVGLTPEMLPMIVTSTLVRGAITLSRQRVIVKRLEAVYNFGAMDVLCTDKTGTLTCDEIAVERHTDAFGQPSRQVLELAYLNSFYQTGLNNLLDDAILAHQELELAGLYDKIDEIPFDFERRRMSVVVTSQGGPHRLICKGALEEVLAASPWVLRDGRAEPLDDGMRARILEVASRLNREGLRVVAVSYRDLMPNRASYRVDDERDLTLAGYIAFLDPPKESSAAALAALRNKGIQVKVLTGDNEAVTLKICRELGLEAEGALSGRRIDALSDDKLAELARRTTVFAKLTPLHKERVVRALRQQGHVVGFLGDGVNDAPALRAADIGISVKGAADIAREAADMILLEKDLMVLEQGVAQGRRTFANMMKYIKMTASSNFGNVCSVLAASALLPFLPMLPVHLLAQNLLYDLSQLAIPFDHVDPEQLERPQRWSPGELGRFMLLFGPLSSLFDLATFAVLWYVFGAQHPAQQQLFQSGWFVEGLLSQTLVVYLLRTGKLPFVQSRPSRPLLTATLLAAAAGLLLPLSPLAASLQLQALPPGYLPWLAAILLGYAALTQAAKSGYRRRFGWR